MHVAAAIGEKTMNIVPMYLPRLWTGTSSTIPAKPVTPVIPLPAPAIPIPRIAIGILWAVPTTTIPTVTITAPAIPKYRRPITSDNEPANGATAAKLSE